MSAIKQTYANGESVILTNDSDKCNAFSEYFSKVYTHEASGDFESLDNVVLTLQMKDVVISENSVSKKLSELKIGKSPGPDSIHSKVLKELAPQISRAFQYIFELSLRTNELPDEWKCSIVTAVHKKGSKASVTNYRPISLTCIACKVLEPLITDHIME